MTRRSTNLRKAPINYGCNLEMCNKRSANIYFSNRLPTTGSKIIGTKGDDVAKQKAFENWPLFTYVVPTNTNVLVYSDLSSTLLVYALF